MWISPDGNTSLNYPQNYAPDQVQFCGGYLDNDTGTEMPWLLADGITNGSQYHKGYLCPRGSKCIEGDNPYNGTVSFDNVPQSLELVFVIMSSNTFSDLLYYTTQSDYLAAALCESCTPLSSTQSKRTPLMFHSLCFRYCDNDFLVNELGK